jgi:MFS family permease
MTISPIVRWLLETNDWRTTMLFIGLVSWALLLPTVAFVRNAPAQASAGAGEGAAAGAVAAAPRMTASRALRSPHFLVLGGTFFLCCAAHSGPIFHTISYAIACGIAPMAAVTIYSLEGLAGLGGRLGLGLLADRFGAKPIIVLALAIQAIAIGTYTYVRELGEFYAVAAVFGAAYGGVMPLYASLARDYFGPHILGTVLGAAMMLSSLGMALGPLVGGWVFDRFDSYAWMFIGSFGIGLAAVIVALAFPPVQRARLQPA